MKLLSLIAIILSFGCMSKVVNKTEKQDLNPIHNISFEQADLDSNGDLSEAQEFATAQQSHGIDTKTPVLWFVVLIFLIGIMVYLTKFLKNVMNYETIIASAITAIATLLSVMIRQKIISRNLFALLRKMPPKVLMYIHL